MTNNPIDKKDRMLFSDIAMGIIMGATRRECGEAILNILCADVEDKTKLELISKLADAFIKGEI